MSNRGPLAAVLIVDPVFAGRGSNAAASGAAALPPVAFGDGAGTNGGALAGAVILTTDEVLTGFYRADANGANRTVTLPSFASLSDATSGVCKSIGDRFEFLIYNAGASNNLVVTGVTNVAVIVADTGDATVAPSHLASVTLVRVSATDIVAAVNLFG